MLIFVLKSRVIIFFMQKDNAKIDSETKEVSLLEQQRIANITEFFSEIRNFN